MLEEGCSLFASQGKCRRFEFATSHESYVAGDGTKQKSDVESVGDDCQVAMIQKEFGKFADCRARVEDKVFIVADEACGFFAMVSFLSIFSKCWRAKFLTCVGTDFRKAPPCSLEMKP